jgi:hypothetical protein
MSRVSFTVVWDQARAFVASELSLLAPVALTCFAVPTLLLSIVVPQPKSLGSPLPDGPWMLWFLPILLLNIFGSMTLVAMTLVPAISVGEAMRRAFARLPIALAVMGLLMIALLFLSAILGLVASLVATVAGWGEAGALSLATTLLVLGSVIFAVRMAVLWPALIDGHEGPIAAVRQSLRLTIGNFWHLLGLLLLAFAVTALLTLTAQLAGGSMLLLLGRLVGSEALGLGLAKALNSVVLSLWLMMIVVYTAFLYRAFVNAEKAG